MNKNHNTFFRIFEEKKKGVDLSNILDVPILLFEEQGPNGNCYTDLEAVKQYYRGMYTDELADYPEDLANALEYLDKQSLDSFAVFENYKDFGFSKYLDSIRSTIVKYFNTPEINPDNITYDEKSKMILVPITNPQDDMEGFVEYIKSKGIFGLDTCVGNPMGFEYDPERELITIPADFSNLNAEYPKG